MYAILVPTFPLAALERHYLLGNGEKRPIPRTDQSPEMRRLMRPLLDQVGQFANPICVWDIDGKYFLKYGQSRVEACLATGYPHLPAIVSGPSSSPPPDLVGLPIGLHTPEEFLACFRDPPYKWWVHASGHLEFTKCWGQFEREIGKHVPERTQWIQNSMNKSAS